MKIGANRQVTFEFGDTEEYRAFVDQHPDFLGAFERLVLVSNKVFGRDSKPENGMQDVCFGLAHACRDDFFEIVLLAVNGHAFGALKLLRGLFERAVTHEHIARNPDKAERFRHFAAIQEYKILVAALRTADDDEKFIDEMLNGVTTVAQIRKYRDEVKDEFQVELCDKCHHMGTAFSWDTMDVPSVAISLGQLWVSLYLLCYAHANLQIHATAASAYKHIGEPQERTEMARKQAEAVIMHAAVLMVLVLKLQNQIFGLGLDKDLEDCEADLTKVWNMTLEAQIAS